MSIDVKICGLKDEASVDAAIEGGAAMIGFVFFPLSPRFISVERSAELTIRAPRDTNRVGLVVDADDQWLTKIVDGAGINMLQLHGDETPERVRNIRQKFGLPVIKSLPIKKHSDLAYAYHFEGVVEYLMFDAKPPKNANRPGGNAQVFDWSLLSNNKFNFPWILAGGLNASNVGEAVKISGAGAVDVSSGVEDTQGCKNTDKIRFFLATSAAL
jgi:phosphoribosylanthranilate isomerase